MEDLSYNCLDCGERAPLDTILSPKQWELICPEDGVLCASCIVRRAAKLPHVINAFLRIQFGDDYEADPRPGGRFYQFAKQCDRGQPA